MHKKIVSAIWVVAFALLLAWPALGANNSTPVATPDSYSVNEDTTLSVSSPGVLSNDTDADGNSLSTVLVSNVTHGTLTLNSSGAFTYRAATNYFGTDSFVYAARDSARTSSPVVVTITINAVNDAPRATNDTYVLDSDTVLTVPEPGILGNDFDVEGSPLRALLVSAPSQGVLSLMSNGAFTYTPPAGFFGTNSFTYRAGDGTSTSSVTTVSLVVRPAPIVISAPPISQVSCVGQSASFSITATGTALRYQWFKGTSSLSGRTNSVLTLNNLTTNDAGAYSVRVTGATNSVTNSATLTVNIPVTATPLTNFTRFVGSIAIFTNTVTAGTGPITFQWLKGGVPLAEQTNSSLVLTNLALEDSGLYSVVISGACGPVTRSATLLVAHCFPSVDVMLVIDRSGSMVGQPYDDARTACTNFVRNLKFGPTNDMCGLVAYNTNSILQSRLTNSGPALEQAIHTLPPPTNGTRMTYGLTNALAELFSARHRSNALPIMVLMSDGLPNSGDSPSNVIYHAQIAKNAGVRMFTVGLGAVDHVLMAGAASSTNDYFYATNSSQLSALFDAISTIFCRPPTNIMGPIDLTLCEGQPASFSVAASGCEGFTYQWRKDGADLPGQTNNVFSIPAVAPADAAIYSVVVSAPCRTVTNSATLVVNSPAVVVTPPASQVSFRGSNVTFNVAATGTTLTYIWTKNGAFVGGGPVLELTNLTTNDAGTYCVIVAGAFCGGAVTNCATLVVSNRAPVALDDNYTVDEDTPLVVIPPGVLGNDSDADGDPLVPVVLVPPTHGTLTVETNGGFLYTPGTNYHGPDTFTYVANDGSSNSNPATVTIGVTPVNDVPVANNDAYSMTADTVLTEAAPGVLANDTDVENTPLTTVLVAGPAHGTLTLNADGSFTYRPVTNYSGPDSFTYRASDGAAISGVATVSITVVPVPITIVTPPTGHTNCPGDTATFNVTATGTALTYQWLFNGVALPGLTNRTLAVRNINATNGGLYCVVVNGAAGGPVTNCAELVVLENAVITVPATNLVVCEGTTAQFVVGAAGTALQYQWLYETNFLTGETNAVLTLTNVALTAAGQYSVIVDGACGAILTNTVSLTVNQNVEIVTPPVPQTSFVGSNATFSVGAIGTGLFYEWFFNGTLVGTNSTLELSNLATNQAGTYCVVVSGVCGSPLTNCTTLTIQNRAPFATDDTYTTVEDTALVIAAPGVRVNDGDIDGDTITAALVSSPAGGVLVFNPDGSFTYTPSLNFTGTVTFAYRVNDTQLDSAPATVTITVTPVNDAPVALDDMFTVAEDTMLSIPAPGVLFNDTDVDGDLLRTVLVTGVAHGTLNLSTNGAFTYTPSLNYTGVDVFTYRASDGALNSGVATVTINVGPINDVPVANNDAYTLNEDTVLNMAAPGVLANDSDPDGDSIASLLVSGPAHGTLTLNLNGSFLYTPFTNYHGGDAFTYFITDGSLTSGVATVSLTINPTNDAPAAINDDAYTTLEDTALTVLPRGILTNDVDVDGDLLTSLLVSNVAHGTLTLSNNGAFVYTPSLNYTGVDIFTYRATDGVLTSEVATVTITVLPLNDVPVANNDSYTVNEDTTLTVPAAGVLANDSDVDGDPLRTVLVSNPASGTLNLSTNGSFTYTPSLNFTGVVTFTYRAADYGLTSSVATVTITVLPLNDVPVANNDSYSVNEDATLTIPAAGVLANDSDVDGDVLRTVLVSNPASGTLNLSTNGGFTYTPSLNFTGVVTFTYRAADYGLTSDVATVTITVLPLNDVPLANNDSYSVNEDTTLTIPAAGVLANDTDVDGDVLRTVLVSNPASGTLNLSTNGGFTYTPSLNFTGTVTFTYRATDGALTSDVATATITVLPLNDVPVANNDSYTVNEDTTLGIPAAGVLGNDSDVDGDVLRTVLVDGPTNGVLNLSTNGGFSYTPSLNFTGVVTFTYRAADYGLTSAVATVTITVLPLNDVPVANNDSYTVNEDTTLTIPAAGVLANDSDVDGDPLRAVLVSNPASGTLNLNTNGGFTYTPSLNFTGVVTFMYRAADYGLTSSVATATITVLPLNDVPVASNDSYTVNEDTTLTVPAAGVLANDSDVDGDPLRAVLVDGPTNGVLNLSTNGGFSYTPSLNFTGVVTFTYRAADYGLTSAVATVTITVLPLNDVPVANNDSYTVNEDTTLTIPAAGVLANDSDVDGDPLRAVLVSNPASGTLNLSTNGSFTYTPSLNFTGVVTFTYRAADYGLTSSVATATITVLPLNDVPVASNDSYSVNEDATLTVPAAGVLANDSDVDGDPLRTVLVSNPASGTLNLSTNGGFTYTPSLNFTGVVTFTYRAADYGLTSDVATVTITVLPLNDVPVANNDSYTVNEDTTLTIPAAGVLANDSDVDGDVLSAVLVSNPATGSLSLNTNGAFTYTPSLHFTGTVTFTYRAADHGLTSAVATVTITVLPLNDAPVASNDTYTVSEDATLVVPAGGVLTNDFDVDGDALTAVLLTNVQHGTLTLGTNGAFTYTPSLNYTGADTFAYVATDGSLTSGVAIVSILVTALNDGPVALNDAYSVNEDTTLTIPAPGVLGNDVDVDGDLLASVLVSGVSHGTLNLSTNGAFTYTPSLNYTGVDVFTYVATDGLLTSVVATVSITVVPVNDPPTTGAAGDSYTVLEDATLTVPSAGVLANDADVDGDSLSAVLVSTTANGLLVLNANGSFTYTPAPNFFGADSFTYRASDGQTGSAPATVSITVLPVNDAPAFAGGGDQKVNQNAPAQTVAWASSISVGPANEAGQTAAFELTNDNGSLFSVQPGIAPNGTLTYTPAPNAFGTATIRVKLRDNGGTANGGANVSAETVFHIVVNSPPTISIVAPTPGAALLFPATFSVISSVNDPDGTVTNVQFLLNGTNLLRVAEAPFYFVMTNAMPGNYQFRAIATDNCGLSATSALVSIDVITNTVVATGPIVLNLQNGLFEQFVTISNRTSTAWPNGVRLAILNLDATNRVWNPTGTNNGAPYIDKIVSIPPGGSTIITVQYYVPNPRTIPNPTLVATPRPFTVPTTVPVLSRITRTEGGVNLHFPTQSGRFYFLQGTENFAQWTTLPAAIAGTGEVVVVPQPAAQAHLFYRLLLVP